MSAKSSQQGTSGSGGDRPSIRLSLASNSNRPSQAGGSASTTRSSVTASAAATAAKKRKYNPRSIALDPVSASLMEVHHQQTYLSFCLHRADEDVISGEYRWYAQGQTSIYLTDQTPFPDKKTSNASNSTVHSLALHMRASSCVTSLAIECVAPDSSNPAATKNKLIQPDQLVLRHHRASFHHADPLEHLLIRPAATYSVTENDSNSKANKNPKDASPYRFHADSQCSRGAAGMTTALRAASIASTMGELRIIVERPDLCWSSKSDTTAKATTTKTTNVDSVGAASSKQPSDLEVAAARIWKEDIEKQSLTVGSSMDSVSRGQAVVRVQQALLKTQSESRRRKRLDLVAKQLAESTCSQTGNRAFKLVVTFTIPLSGHPIMHLGGIHSLTTNLTPHLYTSHGAFGDHEGARSWLPCLDSASIRHRSSHELTIQVTSPMTEGLVCVGMGETLGIQESYLHDPSEADSVALATQELGTWHMGWLKKLHAACRDKESVVTNNNPFASETSHIIPPDSQSVPLQSILATTIWSSCSWAPIPARSLGFAIGPFKILEDPEYFTPLSKNVDEDDDDAVEELEREVQFIEEARLKGHGIRQAYFAPLFERKLTHAEANTTLLPNTILQVPSLTPEQLETSRSIESTVIYCTVGVPNRALSLMKDVLALPSFRSMSYTQIWIPDAVNGGVSSGALHSCPEVLVNAFLGGAIMDARLFPPVGARLPFYKGGRVLQFIQARCAVRGWITAAIPLGGNDDVGNGYLLTLMESFLMSTYERGHGAQGEGGAKGSVFYCKRYAASSGLNSRNLDFLPVQNIEDLDVVIDGFGAVPVEERTNDHLWRSPLNGTESHSSASDEYSARHLIFKDAVEALERGFDKDMGVPTPSMGWFGSRFSLSFLSSNASSSSALGCGAVDMLHPVGGLTYRTLKTEVLRSIIEGRAGVASFIRLLRATFVAAHLDDMGEKELKLPERKKKAAAKVPRAESEGGVSEQSEEHIPKPPFVICVNEILKKKGLTHTLFTRALQNFAGKIREAHLMGTLVDVERNAEDPRTRRPFVDPEGFPNSFVRGSSLLYCRVGVYVEAARETGGQQGQSGAVVPKGISVQAFAEPIIPDGGIAFGGPITLRVVENEGQFREYVKDLAADGSRRDWGSSFLHAKSVTTLKAQTAASGVIEPTSTDGKDADKTEQVPTLYNSLTSNAFTETSMHYRGLQGIELIRHTNLTPLLWIRVDPLGLYGGRISVFQPDACLAEQLFHDGDAAAQIEAMRAMAERPLRVQGSVKVAVIYDVNVSELPARVIGDCLRGSPAVHSSLPHTPVVRSHAAYALAQWQNNKGPPSRDTVGPDSWIGANLLFQYIRERFFSNGVVMPLKFSRLVVKKSESAVQTGPSSGDAGAGVPEPSSDDVYQYLDSLEDDQERATALEEADEVEMEEDEEYRVRSAVINAIACIRAKDGQTPPFVLRFLESILEANDAEMVGNLVYPEEELMIERSWKKQQGAQTYEGNEGEEEVSLPTLSYVSTSMIADALLSLCYINISPSFITDPATGKRVQTSGNHPVDKLMGLARGWLDWEIYREKIRIQLAENTRVGISGNCYDLVSACAVLAVANLAILIRSTTDAPNHNEEPTAGIGDAPQAASKDKDPYSAKFYIDIFDAEPYCNDVLKAACAQAIICVCCAADRFDGGERPPIGLLSSLEFILDRIVDTRTSVALRHTLSLLMMDACTGKACSMQRVGAVGGQNDLPNCAARFLNGPLGASNGGDNGSAILMSVTQETFPSANSVNDGARRGLKLLMRAGHPRATTSEGTTVRVAAFATKLWRAINGEPVTAPNSTSNHSAHGVCTNDGLLRCSFLALWQWIWPRGCLAVLQVQTWKSREGTQWYTDIGAHHVMKISDEEKAAAAAEEIRLSAVNELVQNEIDRQIWRGEMAKKAYEIHKATSGKPKLHSQDIVAAEQGIGQPLPTIQRDPAFKQGGWIASATQQRRALALDGGTAVTKLRLTVKSNLE